MDQIDPIADHPHLRTSPSIREWGSLLIVTVLTIWVVYSPRSGNLRWEQVLHNAGHGPIFGLIAILLLIAARTHRSFRQWRLAAQCISAILASAMLGLTAEGLQFFTHRDPSWMDALNDLVGATLFVSAFALYELRYERRSSVGRVSTLVIIIVGCASFLLFPLAIAGRAYWERESSFPVIANFDERPNDFFLSVGWSALRQVPLPADLAHVRGERGLEVSFRLGVYPGVDIAEPHADWRGYEALALDVANPSDNQLDFFVRVIDQHSGRRREDRFNRLLHIAPRARTVVRIPIEDIEHGPFARSLDLSRVAGLTLFRVRTTRADRMLVQKIWLE